MKLVLAGRNRWLGLSLVVLITLTTLIAYRDLLSRSFSDVDDFLEVHRAVTIDLPNPQLIFTTSHSANRYRPINRLLTAITVAWDGVSAQGFLLRNLGLHLVNLALVFRLVKSQVDNIGIAGLAAGLFAWHPANVNSVSVAVSTHPFETCLCLLVLWIVLDPVAISRLRWLVVATLLLGVLTLTQEMYLWAIPVFVIYLLIKFNRSGKRKIYLAVVGLAILFWLCDLIVRQWVMPGGFLNPEAMSPRYGVKSLTQIALNLGLFGFGGGNGLDYLQFIQPIDQTIPLSLTALLSSGLGLLVAILSSLAITGSTVIIALKRLILVPNQINRLSAICIGLFLLSLSIISVMSTASETYLYAGNAFLAIAQGLIVYDLVRSGHRRWSVLAMGAILVLLLVRLASVEYRNELLVDKSNRIADLQNELRQAVIGFSSDQISFYSPCNPPSGYSIYGGRGMMLVDGSENAFTQLTLNTTQITGSRGDSIQTSGANHLSLIVDNNGKMYRANELADPSAICKQN